MFVCVFVLAFVSVCVFETARAVVLHERNHMHHLRTM